MKLFNSLSKLKIQGRVWLATTCAIIIFVTLLSCDYYFPKVPLEGPIEHWGIATLDAYPKFLPVAFFTFYGSWIAGVSYVVFLLIIFEKKFIWRRTFTLATIFFVIFGTFAILRYSIKTAEPLPVIFIAGVGSSLYYLCLICGQFIISNLLILRVSQLIYRFTKFLRKKNFAD